MHSRSDLNLMRRVDFHSALHLSLLTWLQRAYAGSATLIIDAGPQPTVKRRGASRHQGPACAVEESGSVWPLRPSSGSRPGFRKFGAETPAGRLVRGRGRSPRQGGLRSGYKGMAVVLTFAWDSQLSPADARKLRVGDNQRDPVGKIDRVKTGRGAIATLSRTRGEAAAGLFGDPHAEPGRADLLQPIWAPVFQGYPR